MGTRHLITVISKGETKVAQYGQWDGYPSHQGSKILSFLKTPEFNIDEFQRKVDALRFLELKEDTQKRPYLSRDLGAKILQAIYFGEYTEIIPFSETSRTITCNVDALVDSSTFAADSLFCEWAYVIDLDKKVFEVYKGFNTTPLTPEDRFYNLTQVIDKNCQYHPVKIIKSYDLTKKLPTNKKFLKDLNYEID